MKNIFLIVGASGSGKTTIVEQLEQRYGLTSIQSYTTRAARYVGEKGHTFVSDEEFDKLTDLVAYTEFDSNRYCATAEQVENNDLYVIDPKGVKFFLEKYKDNKTPKVIFIKSNVKTRYERMVSRSKDKGTDFYKCVQMALSRIVNDIGEFYEYNHKLVTPDYTIENNEYTNLDSLVESVYRYICSCESEVV